MRVREPARQMPAFLHRRLSICMRDFHLWRRGEVSKYRCSLHKNICRNIPGLLSCPCPPELPAPFGNAPHPRCERLECSVLQQPRLTAPKIDTHVLHTNRTDGYQPISPAQLAQLHATLNMDIWAGPTFRAVIQSILPGLTRLESSPQIYCSLQVRHACHRGLLPPASPSNAFDSSRPKSLQNPLAQPLHMESQGSA